VIRVAAILLSAGAYVAAFPPWNVTPLAWVALVPFLVALRGLGPWRAAGAGFLWGTAVLSGIGSWVPGGLALYWQQPYGLAFGFALGVAVVFMGQYFALFAVGYGWLRTRWSPGALPWLAAALYVACEFARGRLLTGHPWLLLGYALVPYPTVSQVADVGGVYALSFVLVLANAALVEAVASRRVRPLVPAAVTVAAVAAYGAFRLSSPLPTAPELPLLVVQGNVDLGSQWRRDLYGEGLERYLRLTSEGAAAAHPRLVVWPESAVTFFLEDEALYRSAIGRVLAAADADLIAGGPRQDGEGTRFFNSAFYLTPDARIAGHYDKVHLLPFAEYFPFNTSTFLRRRFERVRSFTAAETPTLLHTRFGDVATLICFEAIFPEVVRRQTAAGASLLVNLSNDGWFGRGAGADQHLMMVALRAVENRMWVVRATTTGVSAIVDPYGRITERTSLFSARTIASRVVPMLVDTP
jgi:apolipoprotein N-acyltransferase